MNSTPASKLDKAMTTEQFTQVVEAILDGKYSWACVLILRFAGYNPLHYIPYRTYNRLMKEHCSRSRDTEYSSCSAAAPGGTSKSLSKIVDLNYLEPINEQPAQVRGGDRNLGWIEYQLFHSRTVWSQRN